MKPLHTSDESIAYCDLALSLMINPGIANKDSLVILSWDYFDQSIDRFSAVYPGVGGIILDFI